jgi:hypothetical protein
VIARTSLITLIFLGAHSGENDVEFRLFLNSRGLAATAAGHHGHRRRGGNAPFLFKHLCQVRRLEDGETGKVVYDFLEICHSIILGTSMFA